MPFTGTYHVIVEDVGEAPGPRNVVLAITAQE